MTPDLKLMAVEVSGKGTDFTVGATHPLHGGRSVQNTEGATTSRDGKRLLLAVRQEDITAPITQVVNWTAVLKK